MKISTKGRYALRLMMDLAENNSGSPISLKDVAKRQDISDKYLEQIISILNKAGYVRSVRGAHRDDDRFLSLQLFYGMPDLFGRKSTSSRRVYA